MLNYRLKHFVFHTTAEGRFIMTKISRNAFCPCGSGKKYKKCCLGKTITQSEVAGNRLALQKKFREQNADKKIVFIEQDDDEMMKMSEIILDFASELLRVSDTKQRKEKSLMLAIAAWNIALTEEGKYEKHIEDCLRMMGFEESSVKWQGAFDVLESLIYKKQTKYASITRSIVDFNFTGTRDGGYLNVISSMPASCTAGRNVEGV